MGIFTSPVIATGFPHKTAMFVYSSGINGYQSLDWDQMMQKFDSITQTINPTGAAIHNFALDTSGTKRLDSVLAKQINFYNYNNTAYRVYFNNNTGNYLGYIVVNSGVVDDSKLEIKGITNLNQLAVQKHANGDTDFTGKALIYF